MKIVFVKEFNTPLQYRAKGRLCDIPAKEAKKFIKDGFARKAKKTDQDGVANEPDAPDDQSEDEAEDEDKE